MKFCTIFVAIILCFIRPTSALSQTYQVAFRHFPNTLSPTENLRLAGSFLIWQMVYPLFYFDETRKLTSKVLDLKATKAITVNFDTFDFCLLSNLKFSDGSVATAEDLGKSFYRLKTSVEGFSHIKEVHHTSTNCIRIKLVQRDLRFFEKLTGVASSLHKFDPARPLYLNAVGDYRLKSISNDSIELEANESIKSSTLFKNIVLKTYEPKLKWTDTDLNFVSGAIPTPEPRNQFREIQPPIKKIYSLVLNLKSKRKRKCFASMINSKEIRELLNIETRDLPGFLPSETLGANERFQTDHNYKKYCSADMTFTWHDFRIQQQQTIQSYFRALGQKHNVTIQAKFHDLESLIKISESGKEYITAISFNSSGSKDAWNSDSAVFFEQFVRKPGFFIFPLPGLVQAVKAAATEDELNKKTDYFRKAHRLLLDSGFVYPLGEVNRNYFYPKSLNEVPWADRVSGIPLISGIK